MVLYTTLNLCRARDACTTGYRKLKKSLPDGWGNDAPISLEQVLESNGLDDAIWALRACTDQNAAGRAARLFTCDCAESVLLVFESERPGDGRPRKAIETARAFADGMATAEELSVARESAWGAARDAAADAAWAAWDAAWAAAGTVAWDAARAAADAWVAAGTAGASRATDAARAAELQAQRGFFLARITEVRP